MNDLRRALRADKPNERVEMCRTGRAKKHWTIGVLERGTGPDEEQEQGLRTLGGVGDKERRILIQGESQVELEGEC